MKSIIISNPVWGYENYYKFCEYSLKSLLYENNLPKLIKTYDVTLHILTKKSDHHLFKKNKTFQSLPKKIKIKFFFFSDSFFTFNKYHKVSDLQNESIKESTTKDYIIFNYADFIWSDGSLSKSIELIKRSKKKFLTFFVLPVAEPKAKKFLKITKNHSPISYSKFSLNNLHREAKLRFWNNKKFTLTPTFIFFDVKNEGLIINAYHQTVLAASTYNNNLLLNGIKGNSLDEYFSSKVGFDSYIVNKDSSKIMVFALCDWSHDSSIPKETTKSNALMRCFTRLNDSQRILSKEAIEIKAVNNITRHKWSRINKESKNIINEINQKYKCNAFKNYIYSHRYFAIFAQKAIFFISVIKSLISKFFLLVSWYCATINWTIFVILFLIAKINSKKQKFKYPTNIKKYKFYWKFNINKILP